MKWNVAIFLCCSLALGQSPSKPALHLPEALASVPAEVKAKSHLEALLPSELPHPFGEAKYAIVESASQSEYSISLYYKLDVGDSGFAAFFSADIHPNYGPQKIPSAQSKAVAWTRGLFPRSRLRGLLRSSQSLVGRGPCPIFTPAQATARSPR